MTKLLTNQELEKLFDTIYSAYFEFSEISEDDIKNIQYNAENKNPLAELILIILDFHRSKIEYINPLTGYGPGDVLDDIQVMTFKKLSSLGKIYPLAYKVAGEIQLGELGRIYFNSDKALPYFKKYALATGDSSIVDNYDDYTKSKWKEFIDKEQYQVRQKYLDHSQGITYSHDPSFYDPNK